MKLLKKISMLVLLLTITSSISFAQNARKTAPLKDSRRTAPTKSPQERADRLTKKLTKQLSLDAKQAASMRGILQDYATELATLKESKSQSLADDKKIIKATIANLRDGLDADILQLLNKEQQQVYTEWKTEKEAKQKNKRNERRSEKQKK